MRKILINIEVVPIQKLAFLRVFFLFVLRLRFVSFEYVLLYSL